MRSNAFLALKSSSLSIFALLALALFVFAPARLMAQSDAQDAQNPQTAPDAVNLPAAVVAQLPESPEARAALAKGRELLFQKHDAKGSLAEFKKVVELEPKYVSGYVVLGNAYMRTGDWTEAQRAFEEAVRLDDHSAVAFLGIWSALNQQQRWSAAQRPLLRSLALDPDSAEANYELGRSLVAQAKMDEAELHVVRAIQINKDYSLPHLLMGDIQLHLHYDALAALAEYREYLRLDPDGPSAASAREIVATLTKVVGRQ